MIQLTGSRIHEMAHECGPDPRHVAEYVGRVAEALSLLNLPHTPAIVVAGSVAHNTCTSASDLDLQVKLPYSTLAHSDTMKLDWVGFNATVAESLAGVLRDEQVTQAGKCIRVTSTPVFDQVDVVPCFYDDADPMSEIAFYATSKGQLAPITSHPARHLLHTDRKDRETNGVYRQTVRAVKSAKKVLALSGALDADDMPSYFLECLVHSLDNHVFDRGLTEAVEETFAILRDPTKGFHLPTVNGVDTVYGSQPWHLTPQQAARAAHAFDTVVITRKN